MTQDETGLLGGQTTRESPREILDRLAALNDCAKVCEALQVAMRALGWYADERHWKEDDWGCLAVIAPPDYGEGGKKARNAIKRVERLTRPERVARGLRDE